MYIYYNDRIALYTMNISYFAYTQLQSHNNIYGITTLRGKGDIIKCNIELHYIYMTVE